MGLHQRNDRGEFVNPAGGGPLKLRVKRGPDGKLMLDEPPKEPTHEETRPDERPPYPGDPRSNVPPDAAGF